MPTPINASGACEFDGCSSVGLFDVLHFLFDAVYYGVGAILVVVLYYFVFKAFVLLFNKTALSIKEMLIDFRGWYKNFLRGAFYSILLVPFTAMGLALVIAPFNIAYSRIFDGGVMVDIEFGLVILSVMTGCIMISFGADSKGSIKEHH